MSFTFTLTDNIMLSRYNQSDGSSAGTYIHRTSDIGQDKGDGYIPLIDEYAIILPGQVSLGKIDNDDKRVNFQGYGYIIEGFNVKCCGKIPYTITFYSPEGYLYGDNEGDLNQDPNN